MNDAGPREVPWGAPSVSLVLPPGEVHIWRAELDGPGTFLTLCQRLLSPEETKRAAAYHFEKDRDRFIIRRGILRKILGIYLKTPPEKLSLGYGRRGKPELSGRAGTDGANFNLSFSDGLALFAFARSRDIGIDIEHIRHLSETEEISSRYFSVPENRAFQGLADSGKDQAFFSLWTCKESFMKATGEGMSLPPNGFCVSKGPGGTPKLLTVAGDPEAPRRWSFFAFTPEIGYTATLAVQNPSYRLRFWKWSEALWDTKENVDG